MRIKIGDNVLYYSCERCRIEKRPRDKEYFTGVIKAIDNDVATVMNKKGHNRYYHVCCLEKLNIN